MMGWREYAKQAQGAGDKRDTRDASPVIGPNVSNVPNVLRIPSLDPISVQREWRGELAKLEDGKPLHDYSPGRWRVLVDDACWLFNEFGDQAAFNGWSTADLFGRWPGHHDGWGGLADRLRGARDLKMGADVATWRGRFRVEQYPRGCFPDLKPFWERGE